MIVGEPAREYLARAKGLANEVKCHKVEVANEEICYRILNGLAPTFNFVREGFVPRDKFASDEHKRTLVKAGGCKKQLDATDGHALAAGFKPWSGQRGRCGGRGGRRKRSCGPQ